jgi:hypothetical protein
VLGILLYAALCAAVATVERVASRVSVQPLYIYPPMYQGCTSKGVPRSGELFVAFPVDERFPAGELARKGPGLFVTSAVTGGAEARSHMTPKNYLYPSAISSSLARSMLTIGTGAENPQKLDGRAGL